MKLTRRNVLGFGGGLAALAVLAACGNNKGLGPDSGSKTSASSGGAKDSSITLSQWYHEYGEEGVKEAVERYASEYPDAKVQVKWNPGDYATVLATELLTDKVPDVFESEMGGSLDMIKTGQLAELTDIMKDHVKEFNPSVMKRFTFEDKIYSIPQTIDMQLLYYRKSLLEKAGVQPPKTFDELVAAAKAVATKDRGGFFAGNDGGVGVLGNMFIWASGHTQLTEDRKALAFLTPEFYDALVKYREFYKSPGLLQAASAEWYAPAAFVNEETAMQWGGLWSLPEIMKAHGDDVGVLPFPAIGAKGQVAVPFGAFGACVAAKGKNVEAAKKFVKWLWIDSEDKQVDFSDSYGTHIPAKVALVPKAKKLAEGPGAEAAKFVTDHGFANDIYWYGSMGEAFSAAVTNVITKGADPKAEFEKFEQQAKKTLAGG